MPRDQRAVCFGNRDLRELRTDAAAARPAGSDGGPVSDRAQAPAAQATLSRLGRLAQLGERLPYKQEVGGSIPSPPIAEPPIYRGKRNARGSCHPFATRLSSGLSSF